MLFLSVMAALESKELFIIERSRDTNTVHYSVNFDSKGNINTKNPIEVFWIKPEKNNKKESLTWIQRKYGYGIHIKERNAEYVNFVLVCQKDKLLSLKKGKDQQFHVFTKVKTEEVILEKIVIDFDDGGGFMTPKVNHISLHGVNEVSKDKVIEIISP